MIVEQFYIIILDEEDNVVHKELFQGLGFPSIGDLGNLLRQVAEQLKEDITFFTAKIDKRVVVVE